MTNTTSPKLFETERKDTDNSLIAERNKATSTLSKASTKSQHDTDEIVKDERSIADQKTATSRADHDDVRNRGNSSKSDVAGQAHLVEERRRADVATGLERSKMDDAILVERAVASKLVTKILDDERKVTDRNLFVERETTDANCIDTSTLLKTEVEAHAITQTTLTSRDEFLAVVSHDLRNPVGAIKSYAEVLLDGSSDAKLGPESQKFVQAIQRNAEVSLRLISDLLDLERFSQGKLELKRSPCSARELARAVVETFALQFQEKKVGLRFNIAAVALVFDADCDRVLQVLTNLVGNAMKFTAPDGEVTVSAKAAKADIEFSVADTGSGIPEDKRKLIFDRFTQLKSSNRTGLGLGLFIAKTLVEAHAGRLWVESEVAKGSTFYFSIPVSSAH